LKEPAGFWARTFLIKVKKNSTDWQELARLEQLAEIVLHKGWKCGFRVI
jgi:hypothetical protein